MHLTVSGVLWSCVFYVFGIFVGILCGASWRKKIKAKADSIREAALPIAVTAHKAIAEYQRSTISDVVFLRKRGDNTNIMVVAPLNQWQELIRIVKGE